MVEEVSAASLTGNNNRKQSCSDGKALMNRVFLFFFSITSSLFMPLSYFILLLCQDVQSGVVYHVSILSGYFIKSISGL